MLYGATLDQSFFLFRWMIQSIQLRPSWMFMWKTKMTTILCSLNRVTRYKHLLDIDFSVTLHKLYESRYLIALTKPLWFDFFPRLTFPSSLVPGWRSWLSLLLMQTAGSTLYWHTTSSWIPPGDSTLILIQVNHAVWKKILKSLTDKNIFYTCTWMIVHIFWIHIYKHASRFWKNICRGKIKYYFVSLNLLGELFTNKTVELRQDQQVITLVVTAQDGGRPRLTAVVAINLQVIPVNHYAPDFPPQQSK